MRSKTLIFVAALLGALLTGALGVWQLQRAAFKRSLEAAMAQQREAPVLTSAQVLGGGVGVLHRRAVLEGQWLNDKTVVLENRSMNGQAGFFVLTPLQLTGQSHGVLVQRGWVPRQLQDRQALPDLRAPAGEQKVVGRLAAAPSRLMDFQGVKSEGLIRQNLDLPAYALESGLKLAPLVLLQTEGTDPLRRDLPAPAVDVHKHYGYAFQWFALCALIAGLYVWFQIILPRRRV
ncbi:SURF1 family protein [Roseateles sp. BYS180W]|uniref:SURF1-like protein n=1 Tax=Roseateles rivi TaxID=3299028 RepID=A0ABW7FRM8_9BURK